MVQRQAIQGPNAAEEGRRGSKGVKRGRRGSKRAEGGSDGGPEGSADNVCILYGLIETDGRGTFAKRLTFAATTTPGITHE